MAELLAAMLLVVGSTVMVIAAVGVARFPDAFMRMHAATKAGVIATGLCLLGVATALADGATWTKVALIIAFLLLTTPIASHVLGRAAWRADSPVAPGTRLAAIEDELPRVVFDAFPEFRVARSSGPAIAPAPAFVRVQRQEDIMFATETSTFTARDPATAQATAAAALAEVILAPTWHRDLEATAIEAASLAAEGSARLSILSIVDTSTVNAPEPVPAGGLHFAVRLGRARLARARDRAADAARLAADHARAAGLDPVVRHVEGKPDAAHFACDRARSLVVMTGGGWFDHGMSLTDDDALTAALALDAAPLLLRRGTPAPMRRLLVLHDGSAASAAAIARLGQHPLLVDRDVTIAGIGRCSEAGLHEAASGLSSHRLRIRIAGRFPTRDEADELSRQMARADVLVGDRTLFDTSWTKFFGPGTWQTVRRSERSLILI